MFLFEGIKNKPQDSYGTTKTLNIQGNLEQKEQSWEHQIII
jgi:hypothetical protein